MRKTCVAVAVTALLCGGAMGADGTWTNTVGGNWGDAANWLDGTAAGGAGTTARFNVVPGVSVTTETAVAVGKLQFDSSSGNNWRLYGEPVTLDAPLPEILVARDTAYLYAPLASTNGFRKTSGGALLLYSRNAIDGEVQLETGLVAARGDLLDAPDGATLTDVFTTGAASLRYVAQGGPSFELVAKSNRATEQSFTSVAMEYVGTLNAAPSGSGSALIDGGRLTGTGLLLLNGNGDVRFSGAPAFEGSLRVRGGRVTVRPSAQKALHPAYGATAHFDASRRDTFTYQPENGTNFITRWNSLVGGRYAEHDGYLVDGKRALPFLVENALNSLPAVDFGAMQKVALAERAKGAYLMFNAEITSARTAFIVL